MSESALVDAVFDPPVGANDVDYIAGGALLIVADSPAAFTRAGAAAAAARIPVSASTAVAEAATGLSRSPRWVMVEIDAAPGDAFGSAALERLLDRVSIDTATGRYSAIVSTPPDLINIVAARANNPRVEQLADASHADRVGALLEVQRAGRAEVRERGAEGGDAMRLRALADEVQRIAGALAQLTAGAAGEKPSPAPAAPRTASTPDVDRLDLADIATMVRTRRLRGRHFDAALFADPAWDMLLDLAGARIESKPVAVSSLCIAAGVPPTTALRWIKLLTDAGLFVRRADPADGRRVFIELSDGAAAGMRAYLADVRRAA